MPAWIIVYGKGELFMAVRWETIEFLRDEIFNRSLRRNLPDVFFPIRTRLSFTVKLNTYYFLLLSHFFQKVKGEPEPTSHVMRNIYIILTWC